MAQRPRLESISGLSPLCSHPQQEGERWLHLCARSLLALFLVAGAKCDKLYVGAFWCEVLSAGIGVSAVNSFISRSLAGREPRSKGQCFIHQNTQPTFNTSNHVRTSYSLSSTSCSPSSWKSLICVTYIIPNTRRHSWLGKSVDTWGYLLSLLQCLLPWDVFHNPEEGKKEAEECN